MFAMARPPQDDGKKLTFLTQLRGGAVASAAAAGVLLLAALSAAPASAAAAQTRHILKAAPAQDKPFAEHHLAVQLSDNTAAKQNLALSVAYILLKFYGPDKIAIEVVAFGPGIDLLRADSPRRARVDSLIAQGVQFDICMNTVETIERETGKTVELNPKAIQVIAGVAQILALTEKGYTLVRP
jgi:intracellular sulfur oxidation DsrE/DsrF family protein